jgi:hypothetical protein
MRVAIVRNQTGYNDGVSRRFIKTSARITGKSEACILHGHKHLL